MSSSETIEIAWVDDSQTLCGGRWTGDPADALEAGVLALDADMIDERYVYLADETRLRYAVSAADVCGLGAALLAGHSMAECYSIWCADSECDEVWS